MIQEDSLGSANQYVCPLDPNAVHPSVKSHEREAVTHLLHSISRSSVRG
jgi:hypothetical protein